MFIAFIASIAYSLHSLHSSVYAARSTHWKRSTIQQDVLAVLVCFWRARTQWSRTSLYDHPGVYAGQRWGLRCRWKLLQIGNSERAFKIKGLFDRLGAPIDVTPPLFYKAAAFFFSNRAFS